MEPEAVTLIPSPVAQKEEVTSAGGSSPSQASGEFIRERKTSDVSPSVIEELEEKEQESEFLPTEATANNWVTGEWLELVLTDISISIIKQYKLIFFRNQTPLLLNLSDPKWKIRAESYCTASVNIFLKPYNVDVWKKKIQNAGFWLGKERNEENLTQVWMEW